MTQNPNAPQPYPGENPPASAAAPPKPLALAVQLMYVGAALSVVGIVLGIALQSRRTDLALREAGLTSVDADSFAVFFTIAAVVGGVIAVALWVLNAVFNARGRSWARILATVLGAIAVLSSFGSFAQPGLAIDRVLSLAQVVLAIVIVVLLWRPESSRFYQAASAPRY